MAAAATAATPREAADVFLKAWVARTWISDAEQYPQAPNDVAALYDTYREIQMHPLAAELGGHGGYKVGAVGALGEACLYAPLFRNFFLEAPDQNLSMAACQIHQVEPEFGVIMGADLPARADGAPHSVEDAWAAVDYVVLCIECCGRRASAEVIAAQEPLGKMADILSAGGVIMGPRLPAADTSPASLAECATALVVNGTEVSQGTGSKCPDGGPAQALAYLANHLNCRGLVLEKGQLVVTGATCITRALKIGDTISATFSGLGSVQTTIEP